MTALRPNYVLQQPVDVILVLIDAEPDAKPVGAEIGDHASLVKPFVDVAGMVGSKGEEVASPGFVADEQVAESRRARQKSVLERLGMLVDRGRRRSFGLEPVEHRSHSIDPGRVEGGAGEPRAVGAVRDRLAHA